MMYFKEGKKMHFMNWLSVCLDKTYWCFGFGIRRLSILNRALLGKWLWRFSGQQDNLWRRVIRVKFGMDGRGGGRLCYGVSWDRSSNSEPT